MFLRTVKTSDAQGLTREYLRLVESYREGGKVRQRVVANIGRKDLLAPFADRLFEILTGEARSDSGDLSAAEAIGAWTWGPMLAIKAAWDQLRLGPLLDCLSKERGGRPSDTPLSDRVFVLVANRLCCPSSEHALADWLETYFVCDHLGRRWIPRWKQEGRVRVDKNQLAIWYRTLDQLLPLKNKIEVQLYAQLRDLFSFDIDLVFYDLTSTYFEGSGPGIAKHGYSRDQRPHNAQILVGVVMIAGFPIAHYVLEGNVRDSKTVADVLDDLQRRFRIGRMILVADRGMVTSENLEALREGGIGYLVGLQRRRREDVHQLIQRATGRWTDCPPGIAASEMANPPKTRVQEVEGDQPGVRVFVVDSEERKQYEQAMRERSMERTRVALENLRARVRDGKVRAREKIGAAAARILSRNHGHRYFDWTLSEQGEFRFFENRNLEREIAYEGKYLIQTEQPNLSPVDAVRAYKELSEVERGFRQLKDVIQMRPIFHRKESRVRAHILVAALAFLLERIVEERLGLAKSTMSARTAFKALEAVRLVELAIGEKRHRLVTRRCPRAAHVLKALKVRCVEPPSPPEGDEVIDGLADRREAVQEAM